jgi:hypothetical protein
MSNLMVRVTEHRRTSRGHHYLELECGYPRHRMTVDVYPSTDGLRVTYHGKSDAWAVTLGDTYKSVKHALEHHKGAHARAMLNEVKRLVSASNNAQGAA